MAEEQSIPTNLRPEPVRQTDKQKIDQMNSIIKEAGKCGLGADEANETLNKYGILGVLAQIENKTNGTDGEKFLKILQDEGQKIVGEGKAIKDYVTLIAPEGQRSLVAWVRQKMTGMELSDEQVQPVVLVKPWGTDTGQSETTPLPWEVADQPVIVVKPRDWQDVASDSAPPLPKEGKTKPGQVESILEALNDNQLASSNQDKSVAEVGPAVENIPAWLRDKEQPEAERGGLKIETDQKPNWASGFVNIVDDDGVVRIKPDKPKFPSDWNKNNRSYVQYERRATPAVMQYGDKQVNLELIDEGQELASFPDLVNQMSYFFELNLGWDRGNEEIINWLKRASSELDFGQDRIDKLTTQEGPFTLIYGDKRYYVCNPSLTHGIRIVRMAYSKNEYNEDEFPPAKLFNDLCHITTVLTNAWLGIPMSRSEDRGSAAEMPGPASPELGPGKDAGEGKNTETLALLQRLSEPVVPRESVDENDFDLSEFAEQSSIWRPELARQLLEIRKELPQIKASQELNNLEIFRAVTNVETRKQKLEVIFEELFSNRNNGLFNQAFLRDHELVRQLNDEDAKEINRKGHELAELGIKACAEGSIDTTKLAVIHLAIEGIAAKYGLAEKIMGRSKFEEAFKKLAAFPEESEVKEPPLPDWLKVDGPDEQGTPPPAVTGQGDKQTGYYEALFEERGPKKVPTPSIRENTELVARWGEQTESLASNFGFNNPAYAEHTQDLLLAVCENADANGGTLNKEGYEKLLEVYKYTKDRLEEERQNNRISSMDYFIDGFKRTFYIKIQPGLEKEEKVVPPAPATAEKSVEKLQEIPDDYNF